MVPNRAGRIFSYLSRPCRHFGQNGFQFYEFVFVPCFGPQISGFPGPQISKFLDFQVPISPNSQISKFRKSPNFWISRYQNLGAKFWYSTRLGGVLPWRK